MELEERKVLLRHRLCSLKSLNQKEWWFTGFHDSEEDVYFSFSVIRVQLVDSICISLFDPKLPKPCGYSWKGYLKPQRSRGGLDLEASSRNFSFAYNGKAETGWNAEMHCEAFDVRLHAITRIPHFTKFDDYFVYDYALLHFFMNEIDAVIHAKNRSYDVKKALGYFDHCFGKVPRKSKWHWIAVQNENCALSVLMNYGQCSQCYSQIYFRSGAGEGRTGRWIRLDQNVSFESSPDHRFARPWQISSTDLCLQLTVIQDLVERERIPPVIPFLIKIDHHQSSVRVRGRVRIDGSWLETGELRGVLEEHHGTW